MKERQMNLILQLLLIPLIALPITRWVQTSFGGISFSALDLFPLFGLMAFTIMWWHYLLGFISQLKPDFQKTSAIYRFSSVFVLLLIILHPLFLALANGLDDPLGSFTNYVPESNRLFLVYGVFTLIVFLLYDLARWLNDRKWVKQNWIVIDSIDDVAFIAVFFHSIFLGSHLQNGWLRGIWIFYGISAFVFMAYKYYKRFDFQSKTNHKK